MMTNKMAKYLNEIADIIGYLILAGAVLTLIILIFRLSQAWIRYNAPMIP